MMNVDVSLLASMSRLKGKSECVQGDFLERYMIKNNEDDRIIDIFELVVYRILIFPQSPGYVDAAVVDLIEQINNQANPVPAIVAKTIRFLNFCRRKGKETLSVVHNCCIYGSEAISGASVKPPLDSI